METVTQTAPNAKPILVKSVAWAWGFEDGSKGQSFYSGNDLFVGHKLIEYRQGWREARKIKHTKHTH